MEFIFRIVYKICLLDTKEMPQENEKLGKFCLQKEVLKKAMLKMNM